ncbi:putative pentatricopeptide repeat-containing protein [Senna tora]|uniref:Putative pentatricopeptide repeat-containing protein n=1 Tax=Senna tora TaxID=362788 RepID=A0A834WVD3_9FABA|nr:putative pentatricopeptide repeat-containing protein [Senna tora]
MEEDIENGEAILEVIDDEVWLGRSYPSRCRMLVSIFKAVCFECALEIEDQFDNGVEFYENGLLDWLGYKFKIGKVVPTLYNLGIGNLGVGLKLHGRRIKYRLGTDAVIETLLLGMYGKLCCLGDAQKVFDKMGERDVVSLNNINPSYVENGKARDEKVAPMGLLLVFSKFPKLLLSCIYCAEKSYHDAHLNDHAMKNSRILSVGGKRMRPSLVLWVAKAKVQYIEMMHIASLIYACVWEERKLRSLREVVPQPYEMLVATLARKFLFAPSPYYIAILQNLEDGGLIFSSYINLEDKVVLKGGGNVMKGWRAKSVQLQQRNRGMPSNGAIAP